MAGSISVLPNGNHYVNWYDKKAKKTWKIYKYKGFPLYNEEMAKKLLHEMQSDIEKGIFRLEKFTLGETEIIPFMREWVETTEPNVSPSTYRTRRGNTENHLIPWFQKNHLALQEIQYDNLVQLLNNLNVPSGQTKLSIMETLHTCLKFAKKARRIEYMPDFPERELYRIVPRPIKWLSSEDQEKVIGSIPEEHQPIFWWLKYHLRRPAEAMALRKEDYGRGIFTLCQGISSKKLIDRIKTRSPVIVPVVAAFLPFLEVEESKQRRKGVISPFMFVNPDGRMPGKRYSHQAMYKLWYAACKSLGINIDMYSGLKHSTASQMVNEDGYSLEDVQEAGQWGSRESVKKYAKVEMGRVRALLERKVVTGSFRESSNKKDHESIEEKS